MTTKTVPFPLFERDIFKQAVVDSFKKLSPQQQMKNPVMFVVWVGSILTTLLFIQALTGHGEAPSGFILAVTLWLWFTVLFANFAEAIAEGRSRAQANAMRSAKRDVQAKKLTRPKYGEKYALVPGSGLRKDDVVLVEVGDFIPGDGTVIEGVASVDESAITDESALTILLVALTLIFLFVIVTLLPFSLYSVEVAKAGAPISITVLVALLVCLIPTTIGALLSAIGIAGMGRMLQKNVIATSGRAVEAAGDVDVLLLDKTGTITLGNRHASNFLHASGVTEAELADAAQLASLADETPEGRSIVVLAKEKFGLRERDIHALGATFVPFSAHTRMSGVNMGDRQIRKGAADSIRNYVISLGGSFPAEVNIIVDNVARLGSTPLVVVDGVKVMGVIELKDIVKGGIKERFAELRRMGIKTIMITGDNRLTAAAIAAEAGVDDFLAEATPEAKLKLIREHQAQGRLVAMTGDGTNDAPALAQADVAVAMNTGTQAAKEAGNMVDLDSNPTKLIEIVETGKQLLITRGSLTTFSIANDVAKYFAIIPAAFATTYPALGALNVMHLATPSSAILSAVIFNALIIIALVPLALKGVKYRAIGANVLLRNNLLIYGLGGIIVPFIGIKLNAMILVGFGLV